MRLCSAFLLLFVCATAQAQYHFTLEPASAPAGFEIFLRVDSDDGCYPANSFQVSRSADVVIVRNTLGDTSPCQPNWVTPRLVSLGTFAAGQYRVDVETCVNSPQNPCSIWESLGLTVYEASGRFAIPTLSLAGVFALVVFALMLGLRAGRSV